MILFFLFFFFLLTIRLDMWLRDAQGEENKAIPQMSLGRRGILRADEHKVESFLAVRFGGSLSVPNEPAALRCFIRLMKGKQEVMMPL